MVADAHSTLAGGNKTHINHFLLPIEGGLHHKRVDELPQVPVLLVRKHCVLFAVCSREILSRARHLEVAVLQEGIPGLEECLRQHTSKR